MSNKKIINIRVTDEQKAMIDKKAGDKSITQFLVDAANAYGASETPTVVSAVAGHELKEGQLLDVENFVVFQRKYGSLERFREVLFKAFGVSTEQGVVEGLERMVNKEAVAQAELERAKNPLFGYVVVHINGENKGATLKKGKSEIVTSEEIANWEQYAHLLYDVNGDWSPLYKVGEVIA